MKPIYIIAIILLFSLLAFGYFDALRLKARIRKYHNGEHVRSSLNKLIRKAENTSLKRFVLYLFYQGILASITVILGCMVVEYFVFNESIDAKREIIIFFTVFVLFSFKSIISALIIWNSTNLKQKD